MASSRIAWNGDSVRDAEARLFGKAGLLALSLDLRLRPFLGEHLTLQLGRKLLQNFWPSVFQAELSFAPFGHCDQQHSERGTHRLADFANFETEGDLRIGRGLFAAEAKPAKIASLRGARCLRVLFGGVGKGDALVENLAAKVAKNTHETNWRITNVLPRINDLAHDDGLFMEYLNSNLQRSPETAERLREFVEGRAAPLVAPAMAPAPDKN